MVDPLDVFCNTQVSEKTIYNIPLIFSAISQFIIVLQVRASTKVLLTRFLKRLIAQHGPQFGKQLCEKTPQFHQLK